MPYLLTWRVEANFLKSWVGLQHHWQRLGYAGLRSARPVCKSVVDQSGGMTPKTSYTHSFIVIHGMNWKHNTYLTLFDHSFIFDVRMFDPSQAYLKIGARGSFTCAPYLLDSAPKKGDHIGWGESNAVVFANSVLGARLWAWIFL